MSNRASFICSAHASSRPGTLSAGAVNVSMLSQWADVVDRLLGLSVDAQDLKFGHMACRTFVVFVFAVTLARLGARRFLAHNAGFDIMVAIVLGSVLSRAINGQASFFPTLGASALLVGLHHVLATLTFHSHWFSALVKGQPRILIRDGKVDRREMARGKITDHDLDENLRLHGNVKGTGDVAEARLERNGSISVVKVADDDSKPGRSRQ
jgi:uncharacterized membrane protein YcaP (DUF421 family)